MNRMRSHRLKNLRGTPSDIDEVLKSVYYDTSSPAAFSSADKIYDECLKRGFNVSRNDVKNFLSGQFTHTLYHRAVKRFRRNETVSNFYTDLAQADLIDVARYSESNKNIKFLLTLIDVFTRFAFVRPLRNKTGPEVKEALTSIFAEYRPNNLQTDAGKEFLNKHVQGLLKDLNINYYVAHNENIKCAVIERCQRTLMQRLEKMKASNGNEEYLSHLQSIVKGINNSYHRTIQMSPSEAIRTDKHILFQRL